MEPNNTEIKSNAYLDEMLSMTDEDHVKSELGEFYNGTNVLITGGSGFIGKLLIEKLLRAFPKIGNIYLLMRAKRGKSSEERIKEQLEDICYEKLKKQRPNFCKHIVLIEGDTGQQDLGLSSENRKILIENTHVVFHVAAEVRFDASLRSVININVIGTKMVLMLVQKMKNIKAFIHVSTAFSHCPLKNIIEEKFYETPMDVEQAIQLVEMFDDKMLEKIGPHIIKEHPNNYTFSKALGEEVVRKYSVGIPTCIVRPSIVVSTYKEPLNGWNNNIYGPTGLVMAGYVCLLRTEFVEKDLNAEFIPADYVVNNIIVAAWDIDKRWTKKTNGLKSPEENKEVVIYNSVTTPQVTVTWDNFFKLNYKHGMDAPLSFHMWYYILIPTNSPTLYYLYTIFLHIIPGFLMDTAARIAGYKPRVLKLYKKIHKFGQTYTYFKLQQWKFNNDNVMKLWRSMNSKDRQEFAFNAEYLNWDEYCYHHIHGIRGFFLKEPRDTVTYARIRYAILTVVHYTLMGLLCFFIYWLAKKLFFFLFPSFF